MENTSPGSKKKSIFGKVEKNDLTGNSFLVHFGNAEKRQGHRILQIHMIVRYLRVIAVEQKKYVFEKL